jgi:glutamyl-tRNA synthetase
MVEEFRLENVNHSPAFFDVKKLTAFNGEYIRALSQELFVSACAPFLTQGPWPADKFDASVFEIVAPLVQTRVATLSEVSAMIDFFFLDQPVIDDAAWNKTMTANFARGVVADFCAAASAMEWTHDVLKQHLETWSTERELKLGKTQAPIRVAITGRTVGPPLFESIEILGREETIKRLTAALSRMG